MRKGGERTVVRKGGEKGWREKKQSATRVRCCMTRERGEWSVRDRESVPHLYEMSFRWKRDPIDSFHFLLHVKGIQRWLTYSCEMGPACRVGKGTKILVFYQKATRIPGRRQVSVQLVLGAEAWELGAGGALERNVSIARHFFSHVPREWALDGFPLTWVG